MMNGRDVQANAAIVRKVCNELRNGTIAPRDAWHRLEEVADRLHEFGIDLMLAEVRALKDGE